MQLSGSQGKLCTVVAVQNVGPKNPDKQTLPITVTSRNQKILTTSIWYFQNVNLIWPGANNSDEWTQVPLDLSFQNPKNIYDLEGD